MRSILALSLLGVAACSSDSFTPPPSPDASTDSGPTPDASGDAPIADAGAKGFCAQQPDGYVFCDDFDTQGDAATGLNGAWTVTSGGQGTAARVNTRFLSPGYALETTAVGGTSSGSVYRNPNVGLITKFSLSFAAYLGGSCSDGSDGVTLPAVGGSPKAGTSYFVALAMSGAKLVIVESTSVQGLDGGVTVTPNFVAGTSTWPLDAWVKVVMDVTFGAGGKTAAVSFDGKAAETLPLKTVGVGAGMGFPGVSIGSSTDVPRKTGCTVTYDDVVFRINGL